MKPLILLISLILVFTCISTIAHAEDSAIKQKLIELGSIIDNEPPFSFRAGIQGKLFLKAEISQMILLVEDNKLLEAKSLMCRVLVEIKGRLGVMNPMFEQNIRQRLLDIINNITQG